MSAAIDLARLPAPTIIEPLDYEALRDAFMSRFSSVWAALRAVDSSLPAYDVATLETDPVAIAAEAWSYLRLADRGRVNDALRAVLAPLSTGSDLDAVAARIGVQRLVVTPASERSAAVMETDERLLARYLLAFSRPAAGSRERYLYEAYTAWPQMHDAAVIGRDVHGRRGDVDLVIAGPGGRAASDAELEVVRAAVDNDRVKPEATSVTVKKATRYVYPVVGELLVPPGPDLEAVRLEASARVAAAAVARMRVGAQVPRDALAGAAYGLSVTRVDLSAPSADIPAAPYVIPVAEPVTITARVGA